MSAKEERFQWERIVSAGDVLRPVVAKFEKTEAEAKEFGKKLDKFLATQKSKCPIHDRPLPINRDDSFSKSWFDRDTGKMSVIYGLCPRCVKEEQDFFVNKRWLSRGVPKKMLGATVENFKPGDDNRKIAALIKVQKKIKDRRGFLILRGLYGTGKTHLAIGVLKKFGGILVTEANLVGELRQSYSDNTGPDDLVDKYRKANCLVLDELDKNVTGTDIPQLLYRILGDRYDNELLTVITSNDTLAEIKVILGGKLVDRMKEDYEIAHCEWESHRHEN